MTSELTQPSPEERAESHLNSHIQAYEQLQASDIARLPDLDVAGYFAFSLMPWVTGRAGEVIYLVNDQEILTAGQPHDFNKIMKLLIQGEDSWPLEIEAFVQLFLRMRAIRYGVLLYEPGGHVLIEPGQLPPESFEPPSMKKTVEGTNYRFWIYDTDRYTPVFWDVWVGNDGTTTFTSAEPQE